MRTVTMVCDNCGAKVAHPEVLWEVGVVARVSGGYGGYESPVKRQDWCPSCVRRNHLNVFLSKEEKVEDAKYPEPKLEEMIVRIVHNAMNGEVQP